MSRRAPLPAQPTRRTVDPARPRIRYLSNSSVPSASANSVQVMKMCEALAERGSDVTLYCRRRSLRSRRAFEDYGVRGCFAVRSTFLPRVPVLSRALYSIWTAGRVALARGPSVVYGRDFYAMALVALLPFGQPLALEVHQPPSNRLEELLQRVILSSRRFRFLVAISRALEREYVARFGGLVEGRTLLARDAAGTVASSASVPPPDPPAGRPLALGYVGSLAPGKGLELILRLAPRLPDCEIHVVGGSDREVERWRAEATAPNLIFHGAARHDEVPALLGRFDVLLAPYQERVLVGRKRVDVADWMSPLKIFEYMAAGRPIVASSLPALREVLVHGENSLLADPGDVASWVARIRALQEDITLRQRLAANARQEFLHHHTWERRAGAVLSALSAA